MKIFSEGVSLCGFASPAAAAPGTITIAPKGLPLALWPSSKNFNSKLAIGPSGPVLVMCELTVGAPASKFIAVAGFNQLDLHVVALR